MVEVDFEFDWMQEDSVVATYRVLKDGTATRRVCSPVPPQWALKLPASQVSKAGVLSLFEKRILPKERFDSDRKAQEALGLTEYDPLAIVRKTHGASMFDNFWVRFAEERSTLKWSVVRLI